MNELLFRTVLKVIKDRPEQTKAIIDSFSDNQYKSKNKLLDCVNIFIDKSFNVAILGCWYGSILVPALAPKVNKIIAVDLDDNVVRVGKNQFFKNYNNVNWGTGDVFTYDPGFSDANLVINTSCEHMRPMNEWPFWNKNSYFAVTSNNMYNIEGHINCVDSIDDFKKQLPLDSRFIFEEEITDERGTRFLLVGQIGS